MSGKHKVSSPVMYSILCLITLAFAIVAYQSAANPEFRWFLQPTAQAAPDREHEIICFDVRSENEMKIYAFSPTVKEATIELHVRGDNIVLDPPVQGCRGLSRNDRDPLVTVRQKNPLKPMWVNYYQNAWYGASGGKPDLKYKYSLPFQKGESCRINQGYRGSTHQQGSSTEYAVDFDLPLYSPIYASRDGEVVAFKANSNVTGSTPEFDRYANRIMIKHSDGSYAGYAHLCQDGVCVKLGEWVHKDQLIGLSGNTRQTIGPHLHFCVFYFDEKHRQVSVPVVFESRDGLYENPKSGDVVTK